MENACIVITYAKMNQSQLAICNVAIVALIMASYIVLSSGIRYILSETSMDYQLFNLFTKIRSSLDFYE